MHAVLAQAGGDQTKLLPAFGLLVRVVGCRQVIEIGPMSGESNVVHWLEERGIEPRRELVGAIFARAKESRIVLEEAEIESICRRHGVGTAA